MNDLTAPAIVELIFPTMKRSNLERPSRYKLNMLSFKVALRGFLTAVRTERNLKIQLGIAAVVILLGYVFSISRWEWMIIVLHLGVVLSLECFNTFVEYLCDLVNPTFSSKVKSIKDISAGAVLISSLSAAINGGIIFWPYFKTLLV